MTRKLEQGLLLLIYSVLPNVCLSSPPTFNMHYMCGRETSAEQFTEWKGGFLLFDSNLLPSDHDLECNITLHIGAYSSVYSPGIVFSFSEWEMDFPDCDRNNLTIIEGDWRQSTGYPRRSIRDLSNPICGSNSTDLHAVYASQESAITLVFKRRKSWWDDDRMKFNITFLAYFEGSCDAYDNTFTCNNERCIDKQFVCLNLNPCGDSSDCKDSQEAAQGFWDTLVNGLEQYAWILLALIGIYVVVKFLQNYHQRNGSFENLPIIGTLLKSYGSHSRPQARAASVSSLRLDLDESPRRRSVTMETHSLSSPSTSSDEESPPDPPRSRTNSLVLYRNETSHRDTDPTAPPPSYHELPPSAPSEQPEPEQPPPPSYDEVMTNNDMYVKDD